MMSKRNRSKTIKNGPKSPKIADAKCQAKENAFFSPQKQNQQSYRPEGVVTRKCRYMLSDDNADDGRVV